MVGKYSPTALLPCLLLPTNNIKVEFDENNLKLFPNPVENSLNIESNLTLIKRIELLNIQGDLIISENTSANKTMLNLIDLKKGIYFVQISTENGLQNFKIVKN